MRVVIHVRRYQASDRPQIRTLHDRVWPPWHKGPEPPGWFTDLERIEECYLAFWVAVEERDGSEVLVGMVGADLPGADVPPHLVEGRAKLAHLSRMRIAPECRRQGVGARLCGTLVDWAAANELEAVVTNTPSNNPPARSLYRKVGFTEVGTTVVGPAELMWFDLPFQGGVRTL
ncbi:Ribosomal protein S18 acetylase RimI [Actinopolymorpha cephalotaxi]|uniref:Ribosomal protein S18 acetylase RimI n=1 Tax=Actinopolymorpha cephalotaxi TaxID=504797 RepID=A0A1I2S6A2_9ACTN|nr:GNAT family N-acetyltransferase [Actinopolymorpha cephalotaxi]NYH87096.1 ribosomal protein S18 acetylase RimI-like enzyme [Actinopolymorpha cephalotaxi]SFG48290.1 Ribosomal protein S18 acetylase RimI [Actinopolymorpha cephalotaxi]